MMVVSHTCWVKRASRKNAVVDDHVMHPGREGDIDRIEIALGKIIEELIIVALYSSNHGSSRHDDRYYRSKDTRDESSDSDASVEENPVQSDVVIEFSSAPSEKHEVDVDKPKRVTGTSSTASNR